MAEVFFEHLDTVPGLTSSVPSVPCMSGHDAMTGPPEEKRKVESTLRGLEGDRPQAGRRFAGLWSHDICTTDACPPRYLSNMYQAMEQIFEPPSKNNQTITDHYCILFQQLPPLRFQTPSPLRDTHKRQERPSSQLQLNQAPHHGHPANRFAARAGGPVP